MPAVSSRNRPVITEIPDSAIIMRCMMDSLGPLVVSIFVWRCQNQSKAPAIDHARIPKYITYCCEARSVDVRRFRSNDERFFPAPLAMAWAKGILAIQPRVDCFIERLNSRYRWARHKSAFIGKLLYPLPHHVRRHDHINCGRVACED